MLVTDFLSYDATTVFRRLPLQPQRPSQRAVPGLKARMTFLSIVCDKGTALNFGAETTDVSSALSSGTTENDAHESQDELGSWIGLESTLV